MDWWWSRLLGGPSKKAASKNTANDPEVRLAKFKRLYHTILGLCNRPRDLSSEGPLLEQLHGCLERVAALLREETRAPAPHLSLQFVASNRIYTVITRAATASQNEPVIQATIAVLAALVDSEEEDFLSNATFSKSLMRLVSKTVDNGTVLISIDTETAVLELLFTITAKIRLQPDILPSWFQSSARPELEDVLISEKKSFAGITQKNDFPLCYVLIERVHYDGRIGDFARTGLLYILEATGRSPALEEWIITSDIPTLLASGLGALYSQLSRELSIVHPDANLPAVLAMSDYSTTHPRATAVSAFSDKHKDHMNTFLSYLAFWQDLLDHCRSSDVKHTLLDHFQLLFLQQLLYPSILQSSDTDAGSSVAVLTYLTAILEGLEYKQLISMILEYLLAIQSGGSETTNNPPSESEPPRSPTTLKKRHSLMILTAPKDPNDVVEPALFNLTDLILNNVGSSNSQAAFAALRLASTILTRQREFAFGSLLRTQTDGSDIKRTLGALELETKQYTALATSIHDEEGLEDAFAALVEDLRISAEAQAMSMISKQSTSGEEAEIPNVCFTLSNNDPFLKASWQLLRTFFTNGVDVNLALSQAVISVASSVEVRLNSWLALEPARYTFDDTSPGPSRLWASHLGETEHLAFQALQQSSQCPVWSPDHEPTLYSILYALVHELEIVRTSIPNMDYLIAVRKTMLQATSLDSPPVLSEPPSSVNSPTRTTFLEVPDRARNTSSPVPARSSSLVRGSDKATGAASSRDGSLATSPEPDAAGLKSTSPTPPMTSIFKPPPPEMPSTTDLLMQIITFPPVDDRSGSGENGTRQATLNHVLTNVVVLQEFILEIVAVLQVRASVFREKEIKFV